MREEKISHRIIGKEEFIKTMLHLNRKNVLEKGRETFQPRMGAKWEDLESGCFKRRTIRW